MILKRAIIPIGISLILLMPIIFNFIDLANVFYSKADYPFESEFFGRFSVYHSKATYVSYTFISILFLLLTILLCLKYKWKIFFVFLSIDILIFLYPLLTN